MLLDRKWCKYSIVFLKFVGFQRFKLLALFNVQSINLTPTLMSKHWFYQNMWQPLCIYVDIRNPSLERVVFWQTGVTLRGFQKYGVLHDVYVQLLMPLSFGACKWKESQNYITVRKGCMHVLLDQTNHSKVQGFKTAFFVTLQWILITLSWTVILEAGDWLFFVLFLGVLQ